MMHWQPRPRAAALRPGSLPVGQPEWPRGSLPGHPAGRGQGTGGTAAPGRAAELAPAARAPSHWPQAGRTASDSEPRPPVSLRLPRLPGRTRPGSESAALTSATRSAGESLPPAARGGRPRARPARVPRRRLARAAETRLRPGRSGDGRIRVSVMVLAVAVRNRVPGRPQYEPGNAFRLSLQLRYPSHSPAPSLSSELY